MVCAVAPSRLFRISDCSKTENLIVYHIFDSGQNSPALIAPTKFKLFSMAVYDISTTCTSFLFRFSVSYLCPTPPPCAFHSNGLNFRNPVRSTVFSYCTLIIVSSHAYACIHCSYRNLHTSSSAIHKEKFAAYKHFGKYGRNSEPPALR